ncbi:anthrone oxygenase family protein [Nocardia sp. NPDC059239]|uniref:anthrone oxygenase family protein n=1 Tax=unclassified Nocardia TaxID=2637762 RepID=UPI0036853CAE
MNWFAFTALVVTGFTACAEFGSYAFVHPVVRRLPQTEHIRVEQGLLRTFGRVMPPLMIVTTIIGVSYAVHVWHLGGATRVLGLAAATSFVVAIVSTVIFNVPINLATGRWNAEEPPAQWKQTRDKWEFFQGLRSWLLLIGFILLAATASAQMG